MTLPGTSSYTCSVTVVVIRKFGWLVGIAAILAAATAIGLSTSSLVAEKAIKTQLFDAKAAYAKGEWQEAEAIYRDLVQRDPDDAKAIFMLGYSLHYQRRYIEARALFEQAESMDYEKGLCQYNIACGYAQLGDRRLALSHLRSALSRGFTMLQWALADPDLETLHNDAEFKQIIENAKRRSKSGLIFKQITVA